MTDHEQTQTCERVRQFLQSIAILAVQAQDCIGSDKCSDLLNDIESDLARATTEQNKLVS